jgi:imidazolonepropionase-like amidohydrolase
MSDYLILKNALLFDGVSETLIELASVAFEDGIVREVRSGTIASNHAQSVDLQGRFLMPGLLDLHFHAYSVSFDELILQRMPKPLLVSHANRLLEGALQRGFTSVRDPGGGEVGLALAIEAGLAISQVVDGEEVRKVCRNELRQGAETAWVEVHVSVADSPASIVVGDAASETVGTGVGVIAPPPQAGSNIASPIVRTQCKERTPSQFYFSPV